MMAAGLVAQKANELGLTVKPWVKTSLAPGSQVVGEYLEKSKLQTELNKLGFDVVGYGCTTCIGNSGPLATELSDAIAEGDLVSCSVLSGNRNFEGRIGPDLKANFLASQSVMRMCSKATKNGRKSKSAAVRPMTGSQSQHMCATRLILTA